MTIEAPTAAATLSAASGLSRDDVDAVVGELIGGGTVTTDYGWDCDALALLYLRCVAPTVPIDEFCEDLAGAPLCMAQLVGENGDQWEVTGDDLASNYYTAHLAFSDIAQVLGEHIRAVAVGEANRADYPELSAISISEGEAGRCCVMAFHYGSAAFKSPVSVVAYFGAYHVVCRDAYGRSTALLPQCLTALGEALRKRAGQAKEDEPDYLADTATRCESRSLH